MSDQQDHICDKGCSEGLAKAFGSKAITDGFGNWWNLCNGECGLEIVRPGKVQCEKCRYDPPET
jgi:hypothetical protein